MPTINQWYLIAVCPHPYLVLPCAFVACGGLVDGGVPMLDKERNKQQTASLGLSLSNAGLFLAVSMTFLFGYLMDCRIDGFQVDRLTGLDLLVGKGVFRPNAWAWLSMGCWVFSFLLSLRNVRAKAGTAYAVVFSMATGLLLLNVAPALLLGEQALFKYTNTYYVVIGLIFLNASIGYIRSVAHRGQDVKQDEAKSQIHINIISRHTDDASIDG